MKRLQKKMAAATPSIQLGGLPKSSCVEHLVSLATTLNVRARERKATVLTSVDCLKCFDEINLGDVCYEAAQAGIVGKPLKLLRDLNEGTTMTIAGGSEEDKFATQKAIQKKEN